MNKKSLVAVLVLITIIIGALVYVFLSRDDKAPISQIDDLKGSSDKQTSTETNTPVEIAKGVYEPYNPEALSKTTGTVLLFFHAPWCPQCREIEETIKESGIPDGVTVLKVDYDTNQVLRQKYGVTLQTTFVKVDNQGNKIASYVAYDEPTFTSVQRELLP